MVYADDTDFPTEDGIMKQTIIQIAPETPLENEAKTEHTITERGNRNTETWRNIGHSK